MNVFRFANPELLYLSDIVLLIIALFIIAVLLRKRTLKKFGDASLIASLMPQYSLGRRIVKLVIVVFAIIFIVIALAQPQFGSKLEEVKRKGIELVIALDVSNSMLAEDISPNRLERAKMEISKLVDKLDGDKIGIIVFAGDAYTQLPMTNDYGAVKLFLKTINTGFVPKQGTAIGSAIDLAIDSYTPETEAGKALIIITDGENHEDDAVDAAKRAAEQGIVVHTLGMGTLKGAPIPIYNRYKAKSYRKDRQGSVVISKLDDQMLNEIAINGNGEFHLASNTSVGLNEILNKIQNMDKVEYETQKFSNYDEKYQYFLGIGIFLLLIDTMLLNRKNRFLKNVHLFETKK